MTPDNRTLGKAPDKRMIRNVLIFVSLVEALAFAAFFIAKHRF